MEGEDMGPPVITVASQSPIVLKEDDSVAKAVQLMAEHNIGAVVIVDGSMKPIGIFTERDLLIKVCAKGLDMSSVKLKEVMTKNPFTIKEETPVKHALEIMLNFGFRHLPIVDESGTLIGIVSIRDLSKPLALDVDVSELHSAG